MRLPLCVLGVLLLVAAAAGPALAIVYIDDGFETGDDGWTFYGGARRASAFLFNDPYAPPSGQHWGIGQDSWGGTVDGGLYKRFYDHEIPGQVKTIKALVEAYSQDWGGVPTPGHVGIRLGFDSTGAINPDGASVIWTDWYWGQWAWLEIKRPCIEGWETVFIDWYAPWATGPMVAKVDWVFVDQVPEPCTLLALGAGLVGLAARRRKQ